MWKILFIQKSGKGKRWNPCVSEPKLGNSMTDWLRWTEQGPPGFWNSLGNAECQEGSDREEGSFFVDILKRRKWGTRHEDTCV